MPCQHEFQVYSMRYPQISPFSAFKTANRFFLVNCTTLPPSVSLPSTNKGGVGSKSGSPIRGLCQSTIPASSCCSPRAVGRQAMRRQKAERKRRGKRMPLNRDDVLILDSYGGFNEERYAVCIIYQYQLGTHRRRVHRQCQKPQRAGEQRERTAIGTTS